MGNYYFNLTGGNNGNTGLIPGSPWLTLQHGLNNATPGQFNTFHIWGTGSLAAKLDFTTYGNPEAYGLLFKGVGAAAYDDGGMPTLDMTLGAQQFIDEGAYGNIHLERLKFIKSADAFRMVSVGTSLTVRECWAEGVVGGGASTGFFWADKLVCERSYIKDPRASGGLLVGYTGLCVTDSVVIAQGGNGLSHPVGGYFGSPNGYIGRNIIILDGAVQLLSTPGPIVSLNSGIIEQNVFYVTPAASAWAAELFNFNSPSGIYRNNIAINAAGVGGVAFAGKGLAIGNTVYNVTTPRGPLVVDAGGNHVASESPIIDPTTGNYTTKELAELFRSGAGIWPGFTSTPFRDKYVGAVQPPTSSGASPLPYIDRFVTRMGGRVAG